MNFGAIRDGGAALDEEGMNRGQTTPEIAVIALGRYFLIGRGQRLVVRLPARGLAVLAQVDRSRARWSWVALLFDKLGARTRDGESLTLFVALPFGLRHRNASGFVNRRASARPAGWSLSSLRIDRLIRNQGRGRPVLEPRRPGITDPGAGGVLAAKIFVTARSACRPLGVGCSNHKHLA